VQGRRSSDQRSPLQVVLRSSRLYCVVAISSTIREFTTCSPEETIALGRELAPLLKPPKLALLRGDLGAGKTTLVKGIAQAFNAASEDDVTSPTFTLIHEYRGPQAILYHIDLYRVDTQRELETLGLDDLMGENHILLIEWGEKFPRFQRERDIEIALERNAENQRKIVVSSSHDKA
jgi:tRNA threonylcarbamoyladenosine biosynthesis protein TsaE